MKIELEKIKERIKKLKRIEAKTKQLPGVLAQRAFIVFLAFFLADLIIGAVIFYHYTFPSLKEESEYAAGRLRINKDLSESILERLDENQEKLKQADKKTYPDLFRLREIEPTDEVEAIETE